MKSPCLRACFRLSAAALTLAVLTGCPSQPDNESEVTEPAQIEMVKRPSLTPEQIDAANSTGMACAARLSRHVSAWFGKKEQTVRFNYADGTLALDDSHRMTVTADEWTALNDLLKLRGTRDVMVTTPERGTKDSLGEQLPITYKLHRVSDTSFDMIYVGMPAAAR